MMMLLTQDRKTMGDFTLPAYLRIFGWAGTLRCCSSSSDLALIAAILGFGGIAIAAAGIAKFIFYIFLILFVVSLLAHFLRGSGPSV